MKYHCLMSVGKLCDNGFAVNFDATHVYLLKVILLPIVNRDTASGLYCIGFDTPTNQQQVKNPTTLSLSPLTAIIEAVAYSAHNMTDK